MVNLLHLCCSPAQQGHSLLKPLRILVPGYSLAGWQTFSVKGGIVNILGFVGCTVSVATSELGRCSMKAARDNMEVNECGSVPIKLYLWTQMRFSYNFYMS